MNKRFTYEFIDPWTNELVLSETLIWNKRDAAKGYYNRVLRNLKRELPKIQSRILGIRKPILKVYGLWK